MFSAMVWILRLINPYYSNIHIFYKRKFSEKCVLFMWISCYFMLHNICYRFYLPSLYNFIVLATWNGRLLLYILCVLLFNYCCLILTVANLDGAIYILCIICIFHLYNIFYFYVDYNLCLIIYPVPVRRIFLKNRFLCLNRSIPLLSASSRDVTNSTVAFLPRVWITWTSKVRQCARYGTKWEELPSCSEFAAVFIEKSQDTLQ